MAEGHNTQGRYEVSAGKRFGRLAIVLGAIALAVVAVTGASAGKKASGNPYNLNHPGTLTVGMTLQFKPQMYLDSKGQPAGYDVVLLQQLAKQWGVKLDIKNLDFNGLIPGLVSRKFDMVSVGLTATPERKKTISFSRPYVPYAQILAQGSKDKTGGSTPGPESIPVHRKNVTKNITEVRLMPNVLTYFRLTTHCFFSTKKKACREGLL